MSAFEQTVSSGARDAVPRQGEPVSVADLLAAAAAEVPDQVALVEAAGGRRTTWAELEAEVDRVARGFSGLGLVAGHRVLLALGNCTEFVAGYLAASRAGLVAVPVNPRAATGELVRMVADSGSRVVLTDRSTVTTVRNAVAGLQDALEGADEELRRRTPVPVVVLAGAPTVPGELTWSELTGGGGSTPAPVRRDADALAVLLYTSGTSGRPRAAMLTHRALLANIAQAAEVRPPMVNGDDVVLGVLPLFHVYGLNAVLGQVLRQRARLVLLDGFDVEGSLDVVEDEAVTVLPVAPAVLAYWMQVDDLRSRLSGVRLLLSGSAPLSPEMVAAFTDRTGIAVHQGYGLTEAAPVVTSTLAGDRVKPGSVGSALPGIELRLADEAGLPPEGEDPGEIQVRGPNLFSGYWPDAEGGPDAEGWWPTGDVGFLDPEGDLFLVDRVKELVIVSGFSVYPSEVEDVLAEVEGVVEVAVIGVPDEETGEAVVAYVRPRGRAADDPVALVAAVHAHAAERLARFKRPCLVEVVAELPHTVTGKVAKGRLRAEARRRATGLLE